MLYQAVIKSQATLRDMLPALSQKVAMALFFALFQLLSAYHSTLVRIQFTE